ncbi:hypothetical protein [Actinophytocola sediminis]
MADLTEILEDIARGDGAAHVIEQQWLDPADITDPILRVVAEYAIAAYEAWGTAAKILEQAAENALVLGDTTPARSAALLRHAGAEVGRRGDSSRADRFAMAADDHDAGICPVELPPCKAEQDARAALAKYGIEVPGA